MGGVVAIVVSALAFLVPLAVPLFVRRWRSYLAILALGVAFFSWLTLELQRAEPGEPSWIGPFLGGLMLLGFAAGAMAKFAMLVGRRPDDQRPANSNAEPSKAQDRLAGGDAPTFDGSP